MRIRSYRKHLSSIAIARSGPALGAFTFVHLLLLGLGTGYSGADSFTEADPNLDRTKVYGYIQFQVINQPIDTNGDGDLNEGRSRVQRARLSVEGRINRYVSYEMDIDPRAPEVNGKLRDAFRIGLCPDVS